MLHYNQLVKNGLKDVTELLLDYIRVLNEHEQYEEVALLTPLLDNIQNQFFEIIPKKRTGRSIYFNRVT